MADSEIADLINAVKEHRKFKQLACYSIQALEKSIEHTNVRWRENIELAISLDAANVVCDILKRHQGHETVLSVCCSCLRKLAFNKTNATVIAEAGAVSFILASIKANPQLPLEVLHHAMELLDMLMSHKSTAKLVLNEETLQEVLGVLESQKNSQVLSSCIGVIEKMTKDPEMSGMLSETTVTPLLHALDSLCELEIDEEAEECVIKACKAFQRLLKSDNGQSAEQRLKELGGIDTFLRVMDHFKDCPAVIRTAGKLMSKMIGNNIAEMLQTLQTAGLEQAAQERILAMIASVATDNKSMDQIMNTSGGVASILSIMENAANEASQRALEETARTLARLASSPKNIEKLYESGMGDQLCRMLVNNSDTLSADMIASMVTALSRVCDVKDDFINQVHSLGAIQPIVANMNTHKDNRALVSATLDFMRHVDCEAHLDGVSISDLASNILAAMTEHSESTAIQMAGISSLINLAATEEGIQCLVSSGVVQLAVDLINSMGDNEELVKEAIYLLSNIAMTEEGCVAVQEAGAFDCLVDVVGQHMDSAEIREAAADLLKNIATDETIQQFCSNLQSFADKIAADEATEDDYASIPQLALGLGTIAMIPENVVKIQQYGGVAPMTTLMGLVANMTSCPNQEDLLATFSSCINSVVESAGVDGLGGEDVAVELVNNCTAVLGKHSKKEKAVAATIRLLDTLTQYEGMPALISSCGAIDAIATDLRIYKDNQEIIASSINVLTAVGLQGGQEACLDVTKRCGRQLIALLEVNTDTEDAAMCQTIASVLTVLQTGAETKEGRQITSKLGAVKTIFALLEAQSANEAVVQACSSCLTAVVTDSDVVKVVERIQNAAEQLESGDEATIDKLNKDVTKLGLLMMCGDFSDTIYNVGGVRALVDIIEKTEKLHQQQVAGAGALMKNCVTAFGRAAGAGAVENAGAIIPALIRQMKEDPSTETLLAMESLAKDQTVLNDLIAGGAVGALVPMLGDLNEAECNSGFLCLASFAASPVGAQQVTQEGGLTFVVEHLREEIDGMNHAELESAVALLSNIAKNGGDTDALLQAGVLDIVIDTLNVISHHPEASPSLVTGVQNLLSCMINPNGMDQLDGSIMGTSVFESGIVERLDNLFTQDATYLADSACMMANANMLDNLMAGGLTENLVNLEVENCLLSAMSNNPNDLELATACAMTIGRLKGGSGAGGVQSIIDKIEQALRELEQQEDPEMRESAAIEINNTMQLLCNLILVEGTLDQSAADQLSDIIQRSLKALATLDASEEKDTATSMCLNLLGRMATLTTIGTDTDTTADIVGGFMDDTSTSDVVMASAISCIGGMASSANGVRSIARTGMVGRVQKKAHNKGKHVGVKSGTDEVATTATAAMEVIRNQAVSNAATLVGTDGGASAVAAVLMGIEDKKIMAQTLQQIIAHEGGLQILLDALCELRDENGEFDQPGSRRAVEALCKLFMEQRNNGEAALYVTTAEQAAALIAASRLQSVKDDVLALLETASYTSDGCLILASTPGVMEALLEKLDGDDNVLAGSSVAILAKMVSHNDPTINGRMMELKAVGQVVDALKNRAGEADDLFLQNACYVLSGMISTVGVENTGLDKAAMRVVQDISFAYPDNEYVVSQCNDVMHHLGEAFSGGTEALLEDRLRGLANLSAEGGNGLDWQCVTSEDGQVYYYNAVTGETSWEQPQVHITLMQEVDTVMDLVTGLDGELGEIDPMSTISLLPLITSHARDKGVVSKVCGVLAAACKSGNVSKLLAEQERIGDIVSAMQYNMNDESLVLEITSVLTNLSEFDKFKVTLSSTEYIKVINDTCWTHINNKDLVIRCFMTLGNLAFNNYDNINSCFEVEVPKTIELSMQTHIELEDVHEAAIFVLGNILAEDEEQKRMVSLMVGDELLLAFDRFKTNVDFFLKVTRCLGSLSLVDECVLNMCTRNSVWITVNGMREHMDNTEALKVAIELLSNFAACEDDEMDEQCTRFLLDQGGLEIVLECMKLFDTDTSMLLVCFEALYNLADDDAAADKLNEAGVVKQTLFAVQNFDYERRLVSQVIKFLSVLTYHESAVAQFATLSGMQIICQAMHTRVDDEEFVQDCMLTISNAVPNAENQAALYENNLVPQLLQLLTFYSENEDIAKYVIISSIRLSTNDTVSIVIAEEGMRSFMKACTGFIEADNAALLSLLFELLGQLAFLKKNIQVIVQHGGIGILLNIMNSHMQSEVPLMVKGITMLDNVCSSDEEFTTVVVEKGGKKAITTLQSMHIGEEELQAAAQSALLSIDAMQKTKEQAGSKVHRGALFARLGKDAVNLHGDKHKKVEDGEAEPEEDPLIEFRSMLTVGISANQWLKGSSKTQLVFVASQWDALLVKPPSKKVKKGERFMIRDIDKIIMGHGDDHMKKSSFGKPSAKAEAKCCLRVLSRPKAGEEARDLLCLSFQNTDTADLWYRALSRLVQTSKLWSHRLQKG